LEGDVYRIKGRQQCPAQCGDAVIINGLSWLALVLVFIQLWLMGSNKYKAGWWFALSACLVWSAWCVMTGSWALAAQQGMIAVLSVRALMNLED